MISFWRIPSFFAILVLFIGLIPLIHSKGGGGGGAALGGALAAAAVEKLNEDELSPALRRSRRDTLCQNHTDGTEECVSIQCDPKYGWCTRCAFVTASAGGKHQPMECSWVPIVKAANGAVAMTLAHYSTVLLLLVFLASSTAMALPL